MTPLEISLKILPALIAILSLLLVIYVGKTYHPMAALHRTYIRIDGILHEKKVFFDYEETRRFLMSHGAADHFGPWIDPVKYLAIRICLAAIGFTVGIYVNAFVGLVGMVIGFFLLPLLLLYINNKDNDALTPQIQTLYSLLQVQIHAGVPMIDALSESYQSFPAGRLRNALSEFSTTIYFNGSFDKSLEELNGKFYNGFIDSLCIILLQARESGQAMELLRDISQQITDMQASLQLKKKEKLNRITTFCLMGIMGAMIGVALYAA
uniref:type II secretion system F family protein n=1 Tax=Waltera intestinalis TaxID=2606635 RepID=UPI003FF13C01